MKLIFEKKTFAVVSTLLLTGIFAFVAVTSANNSWGKYHIDMSTTESEANPYELGDNLNTPAWDASLAGASADWNLSVLKNQVVAGSSNANCDPTSGRVEICNGEYGNNGWLGIAYIWATRGKSNHITQGVVKVNDTYFNTAPYNTPAWRNMVLCQEIGHEFGLDHQDTNFSNTNLGTCMDYTNDPDGTLNGQADNQQPDQHDYDVMTDKYEHLNATDGDTGGPGNNKGGGKGKKLGHGVKLDHNDPASWGQAVSQDAQGRDALFERDLGNGQVLITHVIWVK